jgi:hypothetical protein
LAQTTNLYFKNATKACSAALRNAFASSRDPAGGPPFIPMLEHYVNVGYVKETVGSERARLLELIPTRQLAMVNEIIGKFYHVIFDSCIDFP